MDSYCRMPNPEALLMSSLPNVLFSGDRNRSTVDAAGEHSAVPQHSNANLSGERLNKADDCQNFIGATVRSSREINYTGGEHKRNALVEKNDASKSKHDLQIRLKRPNYENQGKSGVTSNEAFISNSTPNILVQQFWHPSSAAYNPKMLGFRESTSAASRVRRGTTGETGDTTLTVLVHSRTNNDGKNLINTSRTDDVFNPNMGNSNTSSTARLNFNTMKYPDRKALYLLGQNPSEMTGQKWLNKLIARREQRNSQFLERLKQRQDANNQPQKLSTSPFNTRPLTSRTSQRAQQTNSVAPHRIIAQTNYQPHNTYQTSRLPPTAGRRYITRAANSPPRTARRPGHLESSEHYLSNSTGMLNYASNLHSTSPLSQRNRSRGALNEHEITVDLTKENTTNIAYRLLGAYVENNPAPMTKTFMNIGEAPSNFVAEYLEDRNVEKLDCLSICRLWLYRLNYDWDIVENFDLTNET